MYMYFIHVYVFYTCMHYVMYICINLYIGRISALYATPHYFTTAFCFTTAIILFNYCCTTALLTYIQVEVLNSMQLLTAKQCVLLVNLSSGTHFTCFASTQAQILTRKKRVSLFFPPFCPQKGVFTCFTSTKAQILKRKRASLLRTRPLFSPPFSPQRTASAKKTNGSRKSRNGSTLTPRPTLSFPSGVNIFFNFFNFVFTFSADVRCMHRQRPHQVSVFFFCAFFYFVGRLHQVLLY